MLGTVNAGKGQKRGQAVVTVRDNLGNAVEGVTVNGAFTGSVYEEPASGATGPGGAATLTTDATAKGGVSFTFCVDAENGITGGTLPYNPPAQDCASL